jgi:hypothetical protein
MGNFVVSFGGIFSFLFSFVSMVFGCLGISGIILVVGMTIEGRGGMSGIIGILGICWLTVEDGLK